MSNPPYESERSSIPSLFADSLVAADVRDSRTSLFRVSVLSLVLICLSFARLVQADPLVDEWTEGLSGTRLTSYSRSMTRSKGTLTTIQFCRNGQVVLDREGSWSISGYGGGASQSRIEGNWTVARRGDGIFLDYRTTDQRSGSFPIHLENNGRVNIGGASYAVERNRAFCR